MENVPPRDTRANHSPRPQRKSRSQRRREAARKLATRRLSADRYKPDDVAGQKARARDMATWFRHSLGKWHPFRKGAAGPCTFHDPLPTHYVGLASARCRHCGQWYHVYRGIGPGGETILIGADDYAVMCAAGISVNRMGV